MINLQINNSDHFATFFVLQKQSVLACEYHAQCGRDPSLDPRGEPEVGFHRE